MSTQQTDALQCATDLEYSIARHGMQDAFTLNAYRAMKMVLTQHARITELESQLAQRFDAADMAWPHSGPHRAVQLVESSTAGFTAADMATASAQGFRDGVASLAASAGEPVAIRPDIQAVLAMLDVPVIARMSSHEGKLLKPGQEPPAFESAVPLVREWDHRRACESIIAALSRNN